MNENITDVGSAVLSLALRNENTCESTDATIFLALAPLKPCGPATPPTFNDQVVYEPPPVIVSTFNDIAPLAALYEFTVPLTKLELSLERTAVNPAVQANPVSAVNVSVSFTDNVVKFIVVVIEVSANLSPSCPCLALVKLIILSILTLPLAALIVTEPLS